MRLQTLQERVEQKKRKTNPPQTTERVPFQKHKTKEQDV
jgi:hypothetical protein